MIKKIISNIFLLKFLRICNSVQDRVTYYKLLDVEKRNLFRKRINKQCRSDVPCQKNY